LCCTLAWGQKAYYRLIQQNLAGEENKQKNVPASTEAILTSIYIMKIDGQPSILMIKASILEEMRAQIRCV
jgi:hypothetical protein